jgi:hypothetical protein
LERFFVDIYSVQAWFGLNTTVTGPGVGSVPPLLTLNIGNVWNESTCTLTVDFNIRSLYNIIAQPLTVISKTKLAMAGVPISFKLTNSDPFGSLAGISGSLVFPLMVAEYYTILRMPQNISFEKAFIKLWNLRFPSRPMKTDSDYYSFDVLMEHYEYYFYPATQPKYTEYSFVGEFGTLYPTLDQLIQRMLRTEAWGPFPCPYDSFAATVVAFPPTEKARIDLNDFGFFASAPPIFPSEPAPLPSVLSMFPGNGGSIGGLATFLRARYAVLSAASSSSFALKAGVVPTIVALWDIPANVLRIDIGLRLQSGRSPLKNEAVTSMGTGIFDSVSRMVGKNSSGGTELVNSPNEMALGASVIKKSVQLFASAVLDISVVIPVHGASINILDTFITINEASLTGGFPSLLLSVLIMVIFDRCGTEWSLNINALNR